MSPTPSPTSDAVRRSSYAWTLTSLGLSMFMPSLDTSIANVGLPTLARALGAPFHRVQWIVLAYLLAITTLLVSGGRLGDQLGRRGVLQAGIGLFTLASLLCGLAPSLGWLLAARVLQGAGAALMLALTVALVSDAVPPDRTGRAMGFLGTLSALGTAFGPALGGMLMSAVGWRAIFLVNVPLGLLNLALVRRWLPPDSDRPRGGARFDLWGSLVLGAALVAYALATTQKGAGPEPWVWLALAVAALLAFIGVEARVASPLLRLDTFREAGLSAALGLQAGVATVMMATLVVGPFFLARGLGLRTATVGLVMSVGPAMSILSGIPAGRLVDLLGAPRMVTLGLAQMALGAAGLAWLGPRFGLPGYLGAVALLTPGYQLFQAANGTAVMAGVPTDQRGVRAGLLSLARNLGLITGASALGALFAWGTGGPDPSAASAAALAAGFRLTFGLAAAGLGLGMCVGWMRPSS